MIAKKRLKFLSLMLLVSGLGLSCQTRAMGVEQNGEGQPVPVAPVGATLGVPGEDDKPISITGISSVYDSDSESVYSGITSNHEEVALPVPTSAEPKQAAEALSVQIPALLTEFSAPSTRALTPPAAPTVEQVAPRLNSAGMSPVAEGVSAASIAPSVQVVESTSPKIEAPAEPPTVVEEVVVNEPTSPQSEAQLSSSVSIPEFNILSQSQDSGAKSGSSKGKEPAVVMGEAAGSELPQGPVYTPGNLGEFPFARPQEVMPEAQIADPVVASDIAQPVACADQEPSADQQDVSSEAKAPSTDAKPPVRPYSPSDMSPKTSPRVRMQEARRAEKDPVVREGSSHTPHKHKRCSKKGSAGSPLSEDKKKKCSKDDEKNAPIGDCSDTGVCARTCHFGQHFLSGFQNMNSIPCSGLGVLAAGVGVHKVIGKLPIDEKLRHRLAHAFHGGLSTAFLYNLYKWTRSVDSKDRMNGWLLAASYFGADLAFEYGCDGIAKLRAQKIALKETVEDDQQDWDLKTTKTLDYKKLILMSLLKKVVVIGAWEAFGN